MRVYFAIIASLIIATTAFAEERDFIVNLTDSTKPLILYRGSYALIIGIDGYADRWPPLHEARKDAMAVAAELQQHGFEITLKTDKDMRLEKRNIEGLISDFIYKYGTRREARLVIWFAGHGHTLEGEGYIVPQGAPNPEGAPKEKRLEVEDEFRSKAISLRLVSYWMQEIKSRHVLAIFDSCFGGSVFDVGRAATGYDLTEGIEFKTRQFISSGDSQQLVADDGRFQKLFVDALKGNEPGADANRDGYITATELGRFLNWKISNYKGTEQTPRYGKLRVPELDRGELVFKVRGSNSEKDDDNAKRQATAPRHEVAEAWRYVAENKNVRVLEAFIKDYGGSVYAELAQERLDEILGRKSPSIGSKLDVSPATDEAIARSFTALVEPKGNWGLRDVVVRARLWPVGYKLKICFLDGTQRARSRVAEFAQEWLKYANLTFDFGEKTGFRTCNAEPSDIRISFRARGFWSFVGIESRQVKATEPSMNLEGLGNDELPRNSSVQSLRAHVLHEFGHVLGLEHEHQNPNGKCDAEIDWNVAYPTLGGEMRWPLAEVDRELRSVPNERSVFGSYDRQSIMHYSFPAEIFKKGKDSSCWTSQNIELSQSDKARIASMYPQQEVQAQTEGQFQEQILMKYMNALLESGKTTEEVQALASEFKRGLERLRTSVSK